MRAGAGSSLLYPAALAGADVGIATVVHRLGATAPAVVFLALGVVILVSIAANGGARVAALLASER
jgi:hypothetical protein